MRALDLLRMPFAWAVDISVEMPGVRPPMIGRKAREPTRRQQRFALQKDCIFSTTKNIRQEGTRMMIDGMPPPALMAFLADNAPHVVHLSFPSSLKGSSHLLRVYGAKQGRVDRL